MFLEASAMTGEGVDECFLKVRASQVVSSSRHWVRTSQVVISSRACFVRSQVVRAVMPVMHYVMHYVSTM